MGYEPPRREEWKEVKSTSFELSNQDLVKITRVRGSMSGFELVNINKYGSRGKSRVTISMEAIDNLINSLQSMKG